jgi:hypothetical protein
MNDLGEFASRFVTPDTCPRCQTNTGAAEPFCITCGFDLRHGNPIRESDGKCFYCEHVGKLSEEHIFGKWLLRRYPKALDKRTHELARPSKLEIGNGDTFKIKVEADRPQAYAQAVRNVCVACNTGWMSTLHKEAASIVSRFAEGLWPRLTDAEALIFARWVVMVAINLDFKARIAVITPAQGRLLKDGDMPPGFQISIGKMAQNHGGYSFHRSFGGFGIIAQSTIFCIESLAIHVLATIGNGSLQLLQYTGNSAELHLSREIWPTNDPPKFSSSRKRYSLVEIEAMQYAIF